MLLSKAELERLAERHQQKADKAFMVYQETGTRRYAREYERNSDYADAFRMAADAAEDKKKLGALKAELALMASDADKAMDNGGDPVKLKQVANRLISIAVAHGAYARKERLK